MAEPNRMKLRTLIMVAGMIVLPVAAVVNIKVPEFLWSDGAKKGPALGQKPLGGSGLEGAANSNSKPTTANSGKNTKDSASPAYPVVRVGNIDVRPEEPDAVRPASGLEFESPSQVTTATMHEPAGSSDLFLQIQQRLKALGATQYSLETWGATGEAYRFQCRMAAGHDLNYARHFEATDIDPLRVMHTVLEEVEAWKAGRLP
jgi:hypothetical protein